jgi:hypothetical protein
MNPELRRYAWLELTPFTLMMVPGVFALITIIMAQTKNPAESIANAALVGLGLVLCLMGGFRALSSVTGEVQRRTWDFQRMSGLSPARLVFGKVFGAPILAWYAAAWLLGIYVIAALMSAGSIKWLLIVSLLATAVMIHALCVSASALFAKFSASAGERASRIQRVFVVILLFSAGSTAASLIFALTAEEKAGSFRWYGTDFASAKFFIACTCILLALWAMIAAWRVLALQLRASAMPWMWPAFALFCALWFGGLSTSVSALAQAQVFLIIMGVVLASASYVCAIFLLPYDLVTHERFARAREKGLKDWPRRYPAWLLYLALALGMGVLSYILHLSLGIDGMGFGTEVGNKSGGSYSRNAGVFGLWLALLATRDIAFLVNFLITPKLSNAFAKALTIYVVLFWLLPFVVSTTGLTKVAAFLMGFHGERFSASVLVIAIHAALAVGVLFVRWPRRVASSASQ